MLKFRKSLINIQGNTLSLVNNKGKVSLLSGTAIYDRKRKGYFSTIEIIPDKRRDLRYYALYADGSPCNSFVSNGKIFTIINLENLPKELSLIWLVDNRIDYPDIFNSLISYINKRGLKKISKVTSNIKRYLWVYDLEGGDKDVDFEIVANKPLNFGNKLEIFKVVNGNSECLYSGIALAHKSILVPVKFNLDTLEYENFSLCLNWYDKDGNCVPEIINTEFIKQNVPNNNYQLPSVNLSKLYRNYYGDDFYKVETCLDNHKTIIDYNGLLNECSVEIELKFNGSIPDSVVCKELRFNNGIIKDLFVEDYSNGQFNIEIWSTLFEHQQIKSAELCMEYAFGDITLKHTIDITKIYSK